MKIDNSRRNKVNKALRKANGVYHETLWAVTAEIEKALNEAGLTWSWSQDVIPYEQEWLKYYTVTDVNSGDDIQNSQLSLSLYRFRQTGRYEMTARLT